MKKYFIKKKKCVRIERIISYKDGKISTRVSSLFVKKLFRKFFKAVARRGSKYFRISYSKMCSETDNISTDSRVCEKKYGTEVRYPWKKDSLLVLF